MKARWKRKNREKQLKSTITRLTKQVSHLKNHITIKNRRIVEVWSRNKTFIFKIIDRDAFIEYSGTYGHDIEGS